MKSRFTTHPESVGESYFQHMRFAASVAASLAMAAAAAACHAVLPFLFEKTASRIVARLYDRTRNRS